MKIRRVGKIAIPLGERVRLGKDEKPLVRERFISSEQLGFALRRRRRELGYTQQTMAELCNHSVRVIGEIERGRSTVGIGVILDYALALGVDLELSVRGRSS
ncbi:helix-turn-helix domain-containing protein [Slackia isoflavoniconvertens]|uniref:helix-turn-helix domain-containing protein n=1 Tax=Slackia isoflavoniconvertens TaxID=572010 RepID=UPI003076C67A